MANSVFQDISGYPKKTIDLNGRKQHHPVILDGKM